MKFTDPNYYDYLQVSRLAEPEIIEAAYRKLMLKHHPDVDSNCDLDLIKKINVAHDVLSDPVSRKAYDVWLDGRRENAGSSEKNASQEKTHIPPFDPSELDPTLRELYTQMLLTAKAGAFRGMGALTRLMTEELLTAIAASGGVLAGFSALNEGDDATIRRIDYLFERNLITGAEQSSFHAIRKTANDIVHGTGRTDADKIEMLSDFSDLFQKYQSCLRGTQYANSFEIYRQELLNAKSCLAWIGTAELARNIVEQEISNLIVIRKEKLPQSVQTTEDRIRFAKEQGIITQESADQFTAIRRIANAAVHSKLLPADTQTVIDKVEMELQRYLHQYNGAAVYAEAIKQKRDAVIRELQEQEKGVKSKDLFRAIIASVIVTTVFALFASFGSIMKNSVKQSSGNSMSSFSQTETVTEPTYDSTVPAYDEEYGSLWGDAWAKKWEAEKESWAKEWEAEHESWVRERKAEQESSFKEFNEKSTDFWGIFIAFIFIIYGVLMLVIWISYYGRRSSRTGEICCLERVKIVGGSTVRHYVNTQDMSGLATIVRYGFGGNEYSVQLMLSDGTLKTFETSKEVSDVIAKNIVGTAYCDGTYLLRFDRE